VEECRKTNRGIVEDTTDSELKKLGEKAARIKDVRGIYRVMVHLKNHNLPYVSTI
jgi:hypothetical protein